MLKIEDITVSFDGKTVLEHKSLSIASGEWLRLEGPSGSGKTTLMLAAAGILTPQKGSIQNTFKKTAFVFQDDRLLPWLNARENIELALSTEDNAHEIALEWLKKLKLEENAEKLPDELSGGMKRRVNLARALAIEPDFLILDEAFSFLDEDLVAICRQLVLDWQKRTNGAVLAAAHDSTLDGLPFKSLSIG